jgi:hypothetical protein
VKRRILPSSSEEFSEDSSCEEELQVVSIYDRNLTAFANRVLRTKMELPKIVKYRILGEKPFVVKHDVYLRKSEAKKLKFDELARQEMQFLLTAQCNLKYTVKPQLDRDKLCLPYTQIDNGPLVNWQYERNLTPSPRRSLQSVRRPKRKILHASKSSKMVKLPDPSKQLLALAPRPKVTI